MSAGPVAFYYGDGELRRLSRYERVVLQPNSYTPGELGQLLDAGTAPLAYLSLTEDQGPPAPWQRPERNPDWGAATVVVGDPRWVDHVLAEARAALALGYTGLFLDQLNIEFTHPEEIPDLLALIARIREIPRSGYILANRGFGLLPRLADMVDGVLFESFSARWVGTGYGPWPDEVLDVHGEVAAQLRRLDVEVFALDYADAAELANFARRRASRYGIPCFVSNRELSLI